MLLSDAVEGRIVGFFVANERAVLLDDDGVLFAVLNDVALLAPGVKL